MGKIKTRVADRLTREHFKKKSQAFFEEKAKIFGLKKLYRYSKVKKFDNIRRYFGAKIYYKKVFQSW